MHSQNLTTAGKLLAFLWLINQKLLAMAQNPVCFSVGQSGRHYSLRCDNGHNDKIVRALEKNCEDFNFWGYCEDKFPYKNNFCSGFFKADSMCSLTSRRETIDPCVAQSVGGACESGYGTTSDIVIIAVAGLVLLSLIILLIMKITNRCRRAAVPAQQPLLQADAEEAFRLG